MPIQFFSEDHPFLPADRPKLRTWMQQCVAQQGRRIAQLNFIFCSDEYLLEVNKNYLQHDYYTDIITFDTAEPGNRAISADIFISIDRVQENAYRLQLPFYQELHRVLIHGVLHLLGHSDKKKEQQALMRAAENEQLELLQSLIKSS